MNNIINTNEISYCKLYKQTVNYAASLLWKSRKWKWKWKRKWKWKWKWKTEMETLA